MSIFTLQMKFLILFMEEMKSNIIIWKLKGRNTKYRNQIFYSVHTEKYPIYLTITKIHHDRNIISVCSKYDANIMWSCVLIQSDKYILLFSLINQFHRKKIYSIYSLDQINKVWP